jgi:hypothetical protein
MTMGRLLIDYSKNKAPLRPPSPSDNDSATGIRLRYHEPVWTDELVELGKIQCSPRTQGPSSLFPLMHTSRFIRDKDDEDDHGRSKSHKQQKCSMSPKKETSRSRRDEGDNHTVTFRIPKTPRAGRGSRFHDKLHYIDTATGIMSRSSVTSLSTASLLLDDSSYTVCTAPAKVTGNRHNISNHPVIFSPVNAARRSIRNSIQEVHEEKKKKTVLQEEEEEEEQHRSFLPSALSSSPNLPSSTKKTRNNRKKNQQPTLGEWFGKISNVQELATEHEGERLIKYPTKVIAMKDGGDDNDDDDTESFAIDSTPVASRARRRPQRNLSMDDSKSLVSNASRRGGRRPGRNDTKDKQEEMTADGKSQSRRRLRVPSRTKSVDGDSSFSSFNSSRGSLLRSNTGDFSFMAGSRIRIRTGKGGNAGNLLVPKDDASESSQWEQSFSASKRRRPGRSVSCDSLTSKTRVT